MSTNSIIDYDGADAFGLDGPIASFDSRCPAAWSEDLGSICSDREDFLLVLVSSKSTSSKQAENQRRALEILEACGVQPEVLDAADSANALVQAELSEMSGIHGVFPQFFLVQGDRTSFFADFSELEHMNEEGTLAEWLRMELPTDRSKEKIQKIYSDVGSPYSTKEVHVQKRVEHNDVNDSTSERNTKDIFCDSSATKPGKHPEPWRYENKCGENYRNQLVFSIHDSSGKQEEWSNPLLLEKYQDEILALEDYLQETEEEDEEQIQQSDSDDQHFTGSNEVDRVGQNELESQTKPPSIHPCGSSSNEKVNINEKPYRRNRRRRSSISSVATTATITPTSSSSPSRIPAKRLSHDFKTNDHCQSTFSSQIQSEYKVCDEGDISCNTSMGTTSTGSHVEQMLRASIESLRLKCETLTAEKHILEGQLKESREKNLQSESRFCRERSDDRFLEKIRLEQTLRCGYCMKPFDSNPLCPNLPISSRACGHTICRNCCHTRLYPLRESLRTRRYDDNMSNSERLRNTISSDLLMCGIGDISPLYSDSFEEEKRECESCPICKAPKAFRYGKLDVNESLCNVLKLANA